MTGGSAGRLVPAGLPKAVGIEAACPPVLLVAETMTRRRIGVISDTHGLLRPEAVRALRDSESIIHAGDIGKPEVLDALQALAPVKAVRGNMDREPWARGLPKTEAFAIDQVAVYVLHDLREMDLVPEDVGFNLVVSGHSHQPSIQERNGVLFVNPGSAGPKRFRLPVSIALLHILGASVDAELVPLLPLPPMRSLR